MVSHCSGKILQYKIETNAASQRNSESSKQILCLKQKKKKRQGCSMKKLESQNVNKQAEIENAFQKGKQSTVFMQH